MMSPDAAQVLVVDEDGLAGILTEKDLLNRVLAKGLTPEDTLVGDVMTPNPDMVPSTMTVLEALQEVGPSCRRPVPKFIVVHEQSFTTHVHRRELLSGSDAFFMGGPRHFPFIYRWMRRS